MNVKHNTEHLQKLIDENNHSYNSLSKATGVPKSTLIKYAKDKLIKFNKGKQEDLSEDGNKILNENLLLKEENKKLKLEISESKTYIKDLEDCIDVLRLKTKDLEKQLIKPEPPKSEPPIKKVASYGGSQSALGKVFALNKLDEIAGKGAFGAKIVFTFKDDRVEVDRISKDGKSAILIIDPKYKDETTQQKTNILNQNNIVVHTISHEDCNNRDKVAELLEKMGIEVEDDDEPF